MKEYKIISQKGKLFKNSDAEFEKELNEYARQGWIVVNSIFNPNTYSMKVILERSKS
tara:strand:- start:8838 stop:9008 length:171 start_codon:yes stop_codon:yes gene_type:complete